MRFSLSDLTATGDPFQVEAEGSSPNVSADGTLVYLSRPQESVQQQLVRVDRQGTVPRTPRDPVTGDLRVGDEDLAEILEQW